MTRLYAIYTVVFWANSKQQCFHVISSDIKDRFMNGFILVHCWLAKEQHGPHVATRGFFCPRTIRIRQRPTDLSRVKALAFLQRRWELCHSSTRKVEAMGLAEVEEMVSDGKFKYYTHPVGSFFLMWLHVILQTHGRTELTPSSYCWAVKAALKNKKNIPVLVTTISRVRLWNRFHFMFIFSNYFTLWI